MGQSSLRTLDLQEPINEPLFVVIANCFDDDFVVPKKAKLKVVSPKVFIRDRSNMADKCARLIHGWSSALVVVVIGIDAEAINLPNAVLQRQKHAGAAFAQAKGMTVSSGPAARLC